MYNQNNPDDDGNNQYMLLEDFESFAADGTNARGLFFSEPYQFGSAWPWPITIKKSGHSGNGIAR